MPIQLAFTDNNTGLAIPATYWFIETCTIDQLTNNIYFTINGYVSLAQKNAGKNPFLIKSISTTFALLGVTGASTLAQFLTAMYNFALTYNDPNNPGIFFQGATIV